MSTEVVQRKSDMRVCASYSLVLVLLLLICILYSDHPPAFRPSGTTVNKVLVLGYPSVEKLRPMKENTRINPEKERRYAGGVAAALKPKNLILPVRTLLMKQGARQDEVSNNGNDHTKKNISHGRTRKRRSMKRVKKKGNKRDEDGGIGTFTEDYRVPRPHPPRNN